MKIFMLGTNECAFHYQSEWFRVALHIRFQTDSTYEEAESLEEADIIIISSTCACTLEHIMEVIDFLNEILEKKKPSSKTILAGCFAREFTIPGEIGNIINSLKAKMDYIIPEDEPEKLLKILYNEVPEESGYGTMIPYADNSADIFISTGCLNSCTFCKANYQSLPLISAPVSEVKEVLKMANDKKISYLQIKGLNVCQYGLDRGSYELPEVIEYLERLDNVKRVELFGFAFHDAIKGDFGDVLRKSTKVTTLNGSLESGSNRILELMQKGYTKEEILQFINYIRSKHDIDLILNIIAGFPTEKYEDIRETLEVIREIRPQHIEICTYVDSAIIKAHNYPQLSEKEKIEHTRIYAKTLARRKTKHYIAR